MGDEMVVRMPIAEFRAAGYLQEINRRLLHPLGLALEVTINDETGEEHISGVWDCRDDPEGICFGDGMIDPVRGRALARDFVDRCAARRDALGYVVQPLSSESSPDERPI